MPTPGPSTPPAPAPRTPDEFHAHLATCARCMNQPFNLCPVGLRALERVITSGDVRL